VAKAVLNKLATRVDVVTGPIPDDIVERGRAMIERHIPAAA
jgi:hypothetical protein